MLIEEELTVPRLSDITNSKACPASKVAQIQHQLNDPTYKSHFALIKFQRYRFLLCWFLTLISICLFFGVRKEIWISLEGEKKLASGRSSFITTCGAWQIDSGSTKSLYINLMIMDSWVHKTPCSNSCYDLRLFARHELSWHKECINRSKTSVSRKHLFEKKDIRWIQMFRSQLEMIDPISRYLIVKACSQSLETDAAGRYVVFRTLYRYFDIKRLKNPQTQTVS